MGMTVGAIAAGQRQDSGENRRAAVSLPGDGSFLEKRRANNPSKAPPC